MDYNRVQSYIKSHVLPKLDSLPTDVASVRNAFDTWRKDWTTARAVKLDNLDATISSRASAQTMDTVRGGVDTTLQRLTALEGSVAKLEQGLASVETGLAGVEKINTPSRGYAIGRRSSSISIKGAGSVIGFTSVGVTRVNIDGKALSFGVKGNEYAWICKPYADKTDEVYSFSDLSEIVSVYEPVYVSSEYAFEKVAASCFGILPIRFYKSFDISTESSGSTATVIYTLDPT